MQKPKYWKIEGWDSTTKLFEYRVKIGQITEKSMKELLRTLTAKHSLSESEIISCYAKRKTKIHLDLLRVQNLTGGKYTLSCGENPYTIATVEYE